MPLVGIQLAGAVLGGWLTAIGIGTESLTLERIGLIAAAIGGALFQGNVMLLMTQAAPPRPPKPAKADMTRQQRIDKLLSIQGTRSVDSYHKELGHIMWEYCGMERTEEGLKKAIGLIQNLREDYWSNVRVTGKNEDFNQALERAGRVADFMELGELMCVDALHRRESCGGHFRAESQTPEGEALRHDDEFLYVAAWEWGGEGSKPVLHREPLIYKAIELKQRSYK